MRPQKNLIYIGTSGVGHCPACGVNVKLNIEDIACPHCTALAEVRTYDRKVQNVREKIAGINFLLYTKDGKERISAAKHAMANQETIN